MKKIKINLFGFLMLLTLLVMILGAASCNPQKRLYKAVSELNKHPIESAKYCADKYPIVEKYVKGDSVTVYDTLWGYYTDTLIIKDSTKPLPKPVPKIITKTITIVDTFFKDNTARVTEFKLKYLSCEGKYQALFLDYEKAVKEGFEYKKQRNKMRLWFWVLVGAIGAYTVLKVKKILPF